MDGGRQFVLAASAFATVACSTAHPPSASFSRHGGHISIKSKLQLMRRIDDRHSVQQRFFPSPIIPRAVGLGVDRQPDTDLRFLQHQFEEVKPTAII